MTPVALHHVVEGPPDAPLVVLGPSLGATLDTWRAQADGLADAFGVVRYDHRGHGGSPVPAGPYALADLGADVLALLDALDAERAHVGGVSLGGMVATWLAVHAPERVDRLLLCCTSAYMGPAAQWEERAATVRAHGSGAVAPTVVERWLTPATRAREAELVAALEAMLAATPPEGYAGCCAAIAGMDLRPRLGEVRAATLVIAAAQDPSTPPAEHAERLAAAIPGARLERLEDAAHLAPLERPEAVTRLLREHLDAP